MNEPIARRHGYSLVELMIAMAFLATISTTLGAVLSRIINSNTQASQGQNDAIMLCRLGAQFRSDARDTVRVSASEVPTGPQLLVLTLHDGTIVRYDVSPAGLRRTTISAGQPLEQEWYPLENLRVVGWRVGQPRSGEIAIVVGRVVQHPGEEPTIGKQFDLVGVLSDRLGARESQLGELGHAANK